MPVRDKSHPNQRLTTVDDLISSNLLDDADRVGLKQVVSKYAISVPTHLARLIDSADPDDPIARQIIPHVEESITTPDENADPIGDFTHSPVKGLVHRYPDRVLLKAHSACAVYCRFCFRREMVGPGGDTMSDTDLEAGFTYIAAHPEIWEVILTGGDPLVLSPDRLDKIFERLNAIEHVKVIRIHTRVPVAEPGRITDELIIALGKRRATVYVAVHCNHANELSEEARQACDRFTTSGIPLLGQTVLLKGVNDDIKTLDVLFRKMVTARITPYYLHHPDLAPGTGHFRVSLEDGQSLIKQLRGTLSGIALPTYMLDIPGGHGKVPVGPTYADIRVNGTTVVEDVNGKTHVYPPSQPDSEA